ncbi:pisatin demethylase [Biscogniauxia sp. FL1348]|nr:pisatin demethylase [Biscogniauxia sp. FL1348]
MALVEVFRLCQTLWMCMSALEILLAMFLAYVFRSIWAWYRLSHIPGPFWYSISSLPLLETNLSGHSHSTLNSLTNKYGPLVRIGPNSVITTDVKHVQAMEAPKSLYRKGPWYDTFRFQKGKYHSFCTVDETRHAALRTKVGPGYSGSILVERAIDRQLNRLFDLIDRQFLSGDDTYKPVDFAILTQFFAIDTVGDMTYGKPFGFLDEGKDIYDWVNWNEKFFPVASTAATLPFLGQVVQTWPFSELLPKPTDAVGLGRFIKFAEDTLNERFQPDAEPRCDMIAQFLRYGATREEATGEALVQVVAGTDSVAVALRMILLYIHSTPRVYNLLLAELNGAREKGQISRRVQDSEAKDLPYLQATIREGLRVFPALTPLLNKTVPKGGDCVAGFHLPTGTEVGVDVWGILRSKEYWGDDADLFRPERWLKVEEKQLGEMTEFLEVLFGYGKYKCLGRSIAMMELNKVLPELLMHYHFTVIDPTGPVKMMHSAAFWLMKDFWVTISPRNEGEDEVSNKNKSQLVIT